MQTADDLCSTLGITIRLAVRSEFVGDDALRGQALLLHQSDQQPLGRLRITAGLDDFVENITVLVDGSPKPVPTAADGNHHLIQVPDVLSERLLSAQPLRVSCTEFPAPSPDGFMGYDNAALQQHFLDQTQAERETQIERDRMGDDLRRMQLIVGVLIAFD